MPAPLPAATLLVMQPTLKRRLHAASAATIRGRTAPERRGSTSRPGTGWPSAPDFSRNKASNRGGVDLGAFEPRPGVVVGAGGVDAADEVARQPEPRFIGVERLERRGGEDPAEIPDDGRQLLLTARRTAVPRPQARTIFFGGGSSPSRWARLRASLRARRTASAFCRARFSDGFS